MAGLADEQLLNKASMCMNQGQFRKAARFMDDFIRRNPRSHVGHYKLAQINFLSGKPAEALKGYASAIQCAPDFPDAHGDKGMALASIGRFEDAIACYDDAIKLDVDYAEAYYNKGLALVELGRNADALAAFRATVIKKPFPAARLSLAAALRANRLFDEALSELDRLTRELNDYPDAFYNRGNVLRDLERFDEAVASYNRAIALNPDHAESYDNRGLVLVELKRFAEALASHDKAIALKPDYAEAHTNRGSALAEMKRYEEAIDAHVKAIALKPDYAEAYVNHAAALGGLGRFEEALACLDKAIALKPDEAEAHCNRGVALGELKRFDEALASHDKAIELKADHADSHWGKACLQLRLGQMAAGWQNYEWRVRIKGPRVQRTIAAPRLQSPRDLQGKKILVHWEQGFGDTIQMSRYLSLLQDAGAEVLFSPQAKLSRLLRNLNAEFQCVDIDSGAQGLSIDAHIPLMSLPLLFETSLDTIPASTAYLDAEAALVSKWRDQLGGQGYKIGICWKGSSAFKGDAARSFSISHFEKISKLPGVRLISLHKGDGESQLNSLPEGMVVETLGDDFDAGDDAFIDTAAVMKCLDLVITSDTSVAHLAGALGVPVWVALQFSPDWRWMNDRPDSPWYPTMRLFRQQARGDWPGVFDDIAAALEGAVA